MDLLVREVQIERNGDWYTVDLGFRNDEVDTEGATNFYPQAGISDIGDLSVYYAYEDVNLNGAKALATFLRNHEECVLTCRKLFAFQVHIRTEFNSRRCIGSCTPDLSVRDHFSPDGTFVDRWA